MREASEHARRLPDPDVRAASGGDILHTLPDRTRIYLEDREIDGVVGDPPDDTGRGGVSIQTSRLAFPSKYKSSWLHRTA